MHHGRCLVPGSSNPDATPLTYSLMEFSDERGFIQVRLLRLAAGSSSNQAHLSFLALGNTRSSHIPTIGPTGSSHSGKPAFRRVNLSVSSAAYPIYGATANVASM